MADSQPPHTDSRPSSPPIPSETTPLLPSTTEQPEPRDDGDNDPTQNPPEAQENPNEPPRPPRPSHTIILLTTFSLCFAFLSLVFIGVVMLIVGFNPDRPHLDWTVQDCLVSMTAFGTLAVLASLYNLVGLRRHWRPLLLVVNWAIDLVVSLYSIGWAGFGLGVIFDTYYWCSSGHYSNADKCTGAERAIRILAGMAFALSLALGIVHLILLVMRTITAFRSPRWGATWRFPTGQFSVEFTVKLLRQERDVVR